MSTKILRRFPLTLTLESFLPFSLIFIFLGTFLVYPLAQLVSKAFIGPEGFTLEYFSLLWGNSFYREAMLNSFGLAIVTTILAAIISFPLAAFNVKTHFPGKAILSSILLLPLVMPPFVGAIGIQKVFSTYGSLNLLLLQTEILSEPIEWLGSSTHFWVVALLEALHLYPILYLNLVAALANVDPNLDEAAQNLGIPRWQRYRDILFPLARPGLFAGASIVFIWSLTDLGTPLLVGYRANMAVQIFNMVTNVEQNPSGYALVCILLSATVATFFASKLLVDPKKYQMLARGHVTGQQKKPSWSLLLMIYFCFFIVISLATLPHLCVLLTSFSETWFMSIWPESVGLSHYQQVFSQPLAMQSILNSLLFAGAATLVNIFLGLYIAIKTQKKDSFAAALLDALVMLPLAIPGIILAFSYVTNFTGTILDPMNNPIVLLIIAYSIRRLPFMVRAIIAGMQQINPNLIEASASLGASKWHTSRHIILPIVSANIVAGSILCFAYAMLDVSDSLILAMKDRFYPITKAIYAYYLEQGTGEYMASSLGVIAMLILGVSTLSASVVLGKKMGELFRI